MKYGFLRTQRYVSALALLTFALGAFVTNAAAVTISAPANGTTVSGSVNISTTSSYWTDLYIDGDYLAAGPPYTTSWNSGTVADGTHTISVTAFDTSGSPSSSASVNVTVANHSTAKAVTITAPGNGAEISGAVTVTMAVSEETVWTDLYIDGNYFNSGPPYSTSWNSTSVSSGTHTISATAFNGAGAIIGSNAIKVNVNHTGATPTPTATPASTPSPGAVTMHSPANGATVSGSVSISTSSSYWTDLYIDGNYLASGPPYTTSWDSTAVSDGSHSISVTGFGRDGSVVGTASVNVKVDNHGATPTPDSSPSASPTASPTATPQGTPTPGTTPSPTATITGTAYYVDSVAGNDSNPGTSPSAAWQSIARVMREMPNLAPGDGSAV